MRKIEISGKYRDRKAINSQNAKQARWKDIDPDHIIRCYDLYKQGRMTTHQLLDHFPGRTLKAIESKVWKIRGRQNHHFSQTNLNQLSIPLAILNSHNHKHFS